MNKIKITFVLTLIVLAVFFGIRILSGEDDWVCKDGVWVEHGHPESPKPTIECPK